MKPILAGQTLQIKGTLGFAIDPTVRVIEVTGDQENGIAIVEPIDSRAGGLLSWMNQYKIGLDMLRSKCIKMPMKGTE